MMNPELKISEVLTLKRKAEQDIYKILFDLEKQSGLKVDDIIKKTTAGGTKDPWCSMNIKLYYPE